MATSAELLEKWGEKVPVTLAPPQRRTTAATHDVPDLDGAPTGDDLRRLGKLDGQEFADRYVALLTAALEATTGSSRSHRNLSSKDADRLAKAAVASSPSSTLDAL